MTSWEMEHHKGMFSRKESQTESVFYKLTRGNSPQQKWGGRQNRPEKLSKCNEVLTPKWKRKWRKESLDRRTLLCNAAVCSARPSGSPWGKVTCQRVPRLPETGLPSCCCLIQPLAGNHLWEAQPWLKCVPGFSEHRSRVFCQLCFLQSEI